MSHHQPDEMKIRILLDKINRLFVGSDPKDLYSVIVAITAIFIQRYTRAESHERAAGEFYSAVLKSLKKETNAKTTSN